MLESQIETRQTIDAAAAAANSANVLSVDNSGVQSTVNLPKLFLIKPNVKIYFVEM